MSSSSYIKLEDLESAGSEKALVEIIIHDKKKAISLALSILKQYEKYIQREDDDSTFNLSIDLPLFVTEKR
jgi:hypothetical protein